MAILNQISIGDLGTNCYIFGDEKTKEVVVVDPADDGDKIFEYVKSNNYTVKYIILTHGHYDHIGGVKYLKEMTNAEILIHENDAEMLTNPMYNLSSYTRGEDSIISYPSDINLHGGEKYNIGEKEFSIIHTPGHTMGGICILFENNLFSGDTLFKETVGRTDLPHSKHKDILDSVDKLMKLDDNISVFPGHGESTTIGYERKYNPFIK